MKAKKLVFAVAAVAALVSLGFAAEATPEIPAAAVPKATYHLTTPNDLVEKGTRFDMFANGKETEHQKAGTVLTVTVPISSGGYAWKVASLDTNHLKVVSQTIVPHNPNAPQHPGMPLDNYELKVQVVKETHSLLLLTEHKGDGLAASAWFLHIR
ncbi:MAG: hypothetical protein PHP45_11070 [Elusimicrobiales bacterium]|nr:hypothetical protein [Elusimicrobiales bacterium]